MRRVCNRTTGHKARTFRCDDGSERCSASGQRFLSAHASVYASFGIAPVSPRLGAVDQSLSKFGGSEIHEDAITRLIVQAKREECQQPPHMANRKIRYVQVAR